MYSFPMFSHWSLHLATSSAAVAGPASSVDSDERWPNRVLIYENERTWRDSRQCRSEIHGFEWNWMEQINSFIIVYLVNKAYSHWYRQNKWYQPLPPMQNTLRECWTSFIERKQIKRDQTTRYSDTVIKLRYFVGQLWGLIIGTF